MNKVPRKKTAEWREICPISLRNRASWLGCNGADSMAVSGVRKMSLYCLCDREKMSVAIIANLSWMAGGEGACDVTGIEDRKTAEKHLFYP